MIEMRWLKVYSKVVDFDGSKKLLKTTLQYRQMVDKTIYAHAETNALSKQVIDNGWRNMQWSDWIDVPDVDQN
jgi:hypothetical protein